MRIKETKLPPLHLAASNDELRPGLQHISIKEGVAYASDAHMMAVCNIRYGFDLSEKHIEMLNGKLFTRDAWSLIHNAHILDVTDSGIVIKRRSLVAEIKSVCATDVNPPDHLKALKSALDSGVCQNTKVSVNPKYLDISKKIIGTDHLVIEVYSKGGNFCFDPIVDNVFCLIMGKTLDPMNANNAFSLDRFI